MRSRRTFLSKAAGAAVVYRLAGSPPRLRAAGPNDTVGVGHIGIGLRGMSLLKTYHEMPGVKVLCAADAYAGRLERAREIVNGIATTSDYRAVLDRKEVDAVVIATPDHWHHRMVLDALAAGKDVYCEKPLSWSIKQGLEIISAVQGSGRVLQVGSQKKTSPITEKARDLVREGAIGKVTMVRMAEHRNTPEGAWVYAIPSDAAPETIDWQRFLGPAPKRAFDPAVFFRWRCWWEYSGGVATDLFVHMLTSLHEIMSVAAPGSVVSQGGLYRWQDGRTVPDVLNSVFEYDGFLADLSVSFCSSREAQPHTFMGSEGTLVLGGGKRGYSLTLYPEQPYYEAQHACADTFAAPVRARYYESVGFSAEGKPLQPLPPPRKPKIVEVERAPSHYEYFIRSVRDRSPSREDASCGHCAAGAAHLANLAYRQGRKLAWDWKTGRTQVS